MSDDIKTIGGRVVGSWNGNSSQELKKELARINRGLVAEKSSEKLIPRDMPHRDQIPDHLKAFNAYPLWGCDKSGSCLVGASANRIEPAQKVLAFSLIEHHSDDLREDPIVLEKAAAFKHILIATDGSELSNRGLSRGLTLAERLRARVTILSVVQPLSEKSARAAYAGGVKDPIGRHDKQIDDEMRKRYASIEKEAKKFGVTVDMQHEFDDTPAVAIVRVAELENCDLIVMASHGRRGVRKLLLGSQTSEVLVLTKIPVLVVK